MTHIWRQNCKIFISANDYYILPEFFGAGRSIQRLVCPGGSYLLVLIISAIKQYAKAVNRFACTSFTESKSEENFIRLCLVPRSRSLTQNKHKMAEYEMATRQR